MGKSNAALNQAQTLVDLLKNLGVTDTGDYKDSLTEILSEVFPQIGASAVDWNIDVTESEGGGDNAF